MSPKNKGKFGKAKPNIPIEDEFVSGVERVFHWLRPHATRLGFVVGGLVLVLIGQQIWTWNGERKLRKANAVYQHALAILAQDVRPPEPKPKPEEGKPDDAKPADDEDAGDDAKGDDKTFPSIKARAEAALVPLGELQSEYGGTVIAGRARRLQAAVLLDAERWDDAAALYGRLAPSGAPLDQAQAREGIGYALEGKALAQTDPKARDAGLRAALDAFRKVQTDAKGPMHDIALYHQARLMAKLGDKDPAIAMFKQVLEADTNEALRRDVKNRLAALGAPPEE